MNSSYQIITNPQQQGAITRAADVQTLTDQFIKFLDVSPQSVKTYKASIRKFTAYLAENNITAPTRADLLRYKELLYTTHKPTSIALHITAIRLFFQWTKQQGLYPDIAEHIKGAKLDTEHKKDYLSEKQAKHLLKSIERTSTTGKRDYAIISLMLTAGLRCYEISGVNIEDLRQIGDQQIILLKGKGKQEKAKYQKIAEPVHAAILDYLNAREETDGRAPLFASDSNNNKGGKMQPATVSRIVKARLCNAGFISDRLTAHSLRHTCATINLRNGGGLDETQQLMRHTSINTTMIYNHAITREKNNSENRIAAAIF